MAAAAIKHRIDNRSIPLVFLPVLPLRKGSTIESVMVVVGCKMVVADNVVYLFAEV